MGTFISENFQEKVVNEIQLHLIELKIKEEQLYKRHEEAKRKTQIHEQMLKIIQEKIFQKLLDNTTILTACNKLYNQIYNRDRTPKLATENIEEKLEYIKQHLLLIQVLLTRIEDVDNTSKYSVQAQI